MSRGAGIKPISDLFKKYRDTLQAPEKSVKVAFCEIVQDVMNVTIKESHLSYNTYSKLLRYQGSAIVRQELLRHKKELLTHLTGRLGVKSAPKDIL